MKSSVGVSCVFLIDDFGAELDAEHWRQFLGALAGMGSQVIATSTELIGPQVEWLDRVQCELFHVEQGEIHRR